MLVIVYIINLIDLCPFSILAGIPGGFSTFLLQLRMYVSIYSMSLALNR